MYFRTHLILYMFSKGVLASILKTLSIRIFKYFIMPWFLDTKNKTHMLVFMASVQSELTAFAQSKLTASVQSALITYLL